MLNSNAASFSRAVNTGALPDKRLAARRMILVVFLLVGVCAALVRLLIYDQYLPYVHYSDEAVYVALADEIRGFSDQTGLRNRYGLLAPLYVQTNVFVQSVQDWLKPPSWHLPGEYFYTLRLLSVFFGVGTVLAIAWIGWQLGRLPVALIAGLLWAFSPIIVTFNSLAIPDPMLYFVCASGIGCALAAWQRQSLRFLALSLAAGIVAIYLKMWLATAVLPFIVVSLALLLRNRSRLLPIAALYVIAALFAFHFLFVLNPFQSSFQMEDNLTRGAFVANLVNPNRIVNNFWHIAYAIDGGSWLALGVLLLGMVAYFYARRAGLWRGGSGIVIVVTYFLATWWISAGISNVNLDAVGRSRHIFPATVAFLPLWSFFLVQLVHVIYQLIRRVRPKAARLVPVLAGGLLLLLLSGFVRQDIQLITTYSHPNTVNRLLEWFDSSPPRDARVLLVRNSKHDALWNRLWGAYMGDKPFEWWYMPIDEIPLTTPAQFVEQDIRWLVLSDANFTRSGDLTRLRTYLDRLMLVKTVAPVPNQVEGEHFYVYRFSHPQHTADVDFAGQLQLVGYDLSATTLAPGESLQFRPYWQLKAAPLAPLSMFVHVYTAESMVTDQPDLVMQWDGELLPNGRRPSVTWRDTDEIYFGDYVTLTLPSELPPGEYVLAVGVYDYLTGQRMESVSGASHFSIPLTVASS